MALTNFTVFKGDTFSRDFTIKGDDDFLLDLSSYNFRGQIRDNNSSMVGSISFTALDSNTIHMGISSSDTSNMPIGTFIYDVEMFTQNDDMVIKIFRGTFTTLEEVTL